MAVSSQLDVYALPESLRQRLLSPALIVYLDRVRANIGRVIGALGGDADRWRPHVKTTKLPPVFVELARAGVRVFKCATTREAGCLLDVIDDVGGDVGGEAGGDVLLAHPQVGPNLGRLAELAAAHPRSRVSVLCDDPESVESIPPGLGIFVDVNPGMDRTGVPFERRADAIDIARRAGGRLRGVHFYEGHLHDLETAARRREAFACYDRLMELLAELAAGGVDVGEVVTSGTPTFLCAVEYEPLAGLPGIVHRVSPGTVVFHDTRCEQEIPELGLEPAALVFSRVVSRPAEGIVTCDAGSKSIAAETGDPCVSVHGRPGLRALTPSEEHLPLRVTGGAAPQRGEELLLVPRHVCPTVNLAEKAVLVDGGRVVEIAAVTARGHELL